MSIKTLSNTLRKGRNNCCVVGCTNSYNKVSDLKLYSFPNRPYEFERKQKWIQAVRRINNDGSPWKPTPYSRICNQHFIGGLKSQDPRRQAYNPTIFPDVYRKKLQQNSLNCYKRLFPKTASTEELQSAQSTSTERETVKLDATKLSTPISTETDSSPFLEETAVENKEFMRPNVEAFFVVPQWRIPEEMDYYRETCEEEYITPDVIAQNTKATIEELDIKPDIKSLDLKMRAGIELKFTTGNDEPLLAFLADKTL